MAFSRQSWNSELIFANVYYANRAINHVLVIREFVLCCAIFSMNRLPTVRRKSRANKITDVCERVLNSWVSGIMGTNLVSPNLKNDAWVAANSNATPFRCWTRYQLGFAFRLAKMCHMLPANVNPVQAKKPYKNEPPRMLIDRIKIPYAVRIAASDLNRLSL